MRKHRSKWLKENNIRVFCTKISKPQQLLYDIIKEKYPTAVLEYKVQVTEKKTAYLDICIPELKIDIEYDGMYWHRRNKPTIGMSDSRRDILLKAQGWKIFRFQFEQNPLREVLVAKAKQFNIL